MKKVLFITLSLFAINTSATAQDAETTKSQFFGADVEQRNFYVAFGVSTIGRSDCDSVLQLYPIIGTSLSIVSRLARRLRECCLRLTILTITAKISFKANPKKIGFLFDI